MSSQLGQIFRIATWGESHGPGVGVVIDGCPPLIPLAEADIQKDLDRRRPGQSEIVTPRKEEDRCQILSGVFEGKTTGTPISIMVWNKDARPEAYSGMATAYRPSHADYTYDAKFGIRDHRGGGRASARETIGRVAAAAVAKKVLERLAPGMEIVAYVKSIRELCAEIDPATVTIGGCRGEYRALPGCGDGGMDDRADQGGAKRGGLGGWRDRMRGAQCAGGAGGAGFRPAGGGPGEGDAEPAGDEGI